MVVAGHAQYSMEPGRGDQAIDHHHPAAYKSLL
jgi:hypothetical protein